MIQIFPCGCSVTGEDPTGLNALETDAHGPERETLRGNEAASLPVALRPEEAERLAGIRLRAELATKGPSIFRGVNVIAGHEDPHAGTPVLQPVERDDFGVDEDTEEKWIAQAAAHARSDVPWLLALVARLTGTEGA